MSSSRHWGLIIAPGQEASEDNLGMSFRSSIQKWYVECTPEKTASKISTINEYIQHTFAWFHLNVPKYLYSWKSGRIFQGLKNTFKLARVN